MIARPMALAGLLLLMPLAALAQGTEVAFGTGEDTSDQPVEVTAEQLDIDQAAGTALFTGDVLIVQGPMRLSGDRVDVLYGEGPDGETRVERLEATGNVILVNGPDTAEGARALYTVADGQVVMTGDVLLVRETTAIAGEKLTVNVDGGTGLMEGRVRVVFTPGSEDE